MSFFDELQPASFRGVPFGVFQSEKAFGRRVAVHEYPFRDKPWIEDLGRGTRRIQFVAFLVEDSLIYGGGSVLAQQEQMIGACEAAGPGTLVHPTLGELTVSCPDGGCIITERYEDGRVFEIGFTFIESGERTFPSAANDTTVNSTDAADALDTAAGDDFFDTASAALEQGSAVIRQAVETASSWVGTLNRLARDATSLTAMVAVLPGNLGRFAGGGTLGFLGRVVPPGSPTTIQGLIIQGANGRAAVTAAGAALLAAAGGSQPRLMAQAAQAASAALLGATVDPGVGLRLFGELADFYPASPTTPSVIGMAMGAMQTGLGALSRRAALASIVRTSAAYQPSSRNDAAAVRDNLCSLVDGEIVVAGDSADDASYAALKAMRAAMVIDLNARGGSLPPMTTFDFPANLTALNLAQRIYQGADRNNELVLQADPPHPAFMPVTFSALAV